MPGEASADDSFEIASTETDRWKEGFMDGKEIAAKGKATERAVKANSGVKNLTIMDIASEFDNMISGGAPVADIAAFLASCEPTQIALLAVLSKKALDLLTTNTSRNWPEEHAAVLGKFLQRMPCIPELESYPCGKKDLFMAEALQDQDIPQKLRVHLWKTLVMEGYKLPCYTKNYTWSVPPSLYDHPAVRRWISLSRQPGWEELRCSDSLLWKDKPQNTFEDKEGKAAMEAIKKDSPSALLMPFCIAGKQLPFQYLFAALSTGAMKILTYVFIEDKNQQSTFSPKQLLFYLCATCKSELAISLIKMLEEDSPGLVKNSTDIFEHDALWYTLYRKDRVSKTASSDSYAMTPLDSLLVEFGCDPDRKNQIGLSYRDLVLS